MATTKSNPIRSVAALKRSIAYIKNEEKTGEDGITLVSYSNCGAETAYDDFISERKFYNVTNKEYKVFGHHIKQNFKPGEIDGKRAHEIGVELAKRFLKDEYQYIVATHVDKHHIHNHIIFNSISRISGKQYESSPRDYYRLRGKSDELCKEYGLSIVEPKNQGKHYKEWLENLRGNSWKAKIKEDIDLVIKKVKTYQDFLSEMRRNGYYIKEGKHISYKPKDKERYVRGKTLGSDYTREGIETRLEFKKLGLEVYTFKEKSGRTYKLNPIKYKYYRSKTTVIIRLSIMLALKVLGKLDIKKTTNIAQFQKDEMVESLSKQLTLMRNEKIYSVDDFKSYAEKAQLNLMKVQNKRRSLSLDKRDIKEVIDNIEVFKKYLKYSKDKKDSLEKRSFLAARGFLLKIGVTDTGIETDLKEKIIKIEKEENLLRARKDELTEKNDLINELENTIAKVIHKEKPFFIERNQKKEDRER